ncbi:MAG TPA: ABC transporter ATP-binding protein [Actinospica sp.]|nr:ABC transporter ATP-binding protein [Actinospica sp.]
MTATTTGAPARPVVSARGLAKSYGARAAVAGLDFDIARGEAVGFLGPNGAGKSTMMRMLGCVSVPGSGELEVFGLSAAREARAVRARLGVVPQDDTLDMELTVAENVYVYGRYFGLPRAVIRERSRQLLEFFQLAERASSRVETLSGGQRRRLTIARALISDPELVLLDEPTNGLDPQARHALWDRLRELQGRGTSLVLTTHFMDEAEQLCDRVFLMDAGRIIAVGSPRELIAHYCGREVLELHFPGREAGEHAERAAAAAERVEVLSDRLLLHVADGDRALSALTGVVPFDSALVRRACLEDVFLRLSGRELTDS